MLVFAVFDSKSQTYGLPLFFITEGVAIRSFTIEVNRSESMLFQFPEDYTLFQLGAFDQSNGTFSLLATPHPVLKAIQVKTDKMEG